MYGLITLVAVVVVVPPLLWAYSRLCGWHKPHAERLAELEEWANRAKRE